MKISIIIPAYNAQKFLETALESSFNQDWEGEKEIIVVNDGSTDGTKEICVKYKEKITYVEHEENKGIAAARNSGVKVATGDYITFISADDFLMPDFLSTMTKHAEKDNILYCPYYICNEDLKPKISYDSPSFKNDIDFRIAAWESGKKNTMFTLWDGIFIPSAIQKENLYDEDFRFGEDLYMLLLLSVVKKIPFKKVNKILVKYRTHPENVTTTRNKDIPENNKKIFAKIKEMLK